MKYAMFESGGKQYVARPGETVEVDHLPLNVGVKAEFKEVLLVSDGAEVQVGKPYVEGASVSGRVVGHTRAPKVIVFKYIPKERYRRKRGHRQQYTAIEIQEILLPGAKSVRAEPAEGEPTARKAAAKRSAAKKSAAKGVKKASKSTKKAAVKRPAGKKATGKE